MTDYSILKPLLLQVAAVLIVAIYHRRRAPLHINILISSAFVTVPVYWLPSLADVGMLFMFDICVPLVVFRELWVHGFYFPRRSVAIALVVFLVPLLFFPLSYFFLDPAYINFHGIITFLLLYRALLISCAVAVLMRAAIKIPIEGIARLAGWQTTALLMMGGLQYLSGVDLVVYERLKDVENVVSIMLGGTEKTLFGFGFLGLFRGAVPQMVIVGLFWWLLLIEREKDGQSQGNQILLTMALGAVCVLGTLSRSGLVVVLAAYLYCFAIIYKSIAHVIGLAIIGIISVLFLSSIPGLDIAADLFFGRFDFDQLLGRSGSGATRIESILALFHDLLDDPWRWLVGLGGFNPIAAHERYGVFGMHGDYFDLIARYGLISSLLIAMVIFGFFQNGLKGFVSGSNKDKRLAHAVGVLALGFGILAFTQGVLMFSGVAGYLACAQSWMAIGAAAAIRIKLDRDKLTLSSRRGFADA